jgi:hypothetical protein
MGDEGHRVIARIAAERLTPEARAEVEDLLRGPAANVMADAATWADEIKPQRPETRPWHYVNIPINDLVYRTSLCPQGACVVAQIEREVQIVGDKALLKPVRAEGLRFLIHFVGDEHQPLHCGENHDRGGNEVKVRLNGRDTNLHAVWDGDMVKKLGDDDERLANDLAQKVTTANAKTWSKGTATSWCVETARIAKATVYANLAGQGATALPLVLSLKTTSTRTRPWRPSNSRKPASGSP